jgi:uncharacterized protein YdeI (YjbR/CyaY-like superfamily)
MNQARTIPIRSFSTPSNWRQWLAMNHAKSSGVWLRMFKKSSGEKTVSQKTNDKTQVRFTHQGLVPEYDCFNVYSNVWALISTAVYGV